MSKPRKIEQKVIEELDKVSEPEVNDAPTPTAITTEISVYYPEQLFGPVPYNSFRCGGLWYKTVVQPGETQDEAYDRAWAYLSKLVQKQFVDCRKDFWDRYNSMTV